MSIDPNKLVQQIFNAQNQVRTNPISYIPILKHMMPLFKDNILYKPNQIPLATQEGPAAVEELITFLSTIEPMNPLVLSHEMSKASEDHANDIGSKGIVSHTGSDGSSMTERIDRYGEWMGKIAENIDFGGASGEEIIINLMIDDGNINRGHRKNIFETSFHVTGIAFAPHKKYGYCCVLNYASQFSKKVQGEQLISNLPIQSKSESQDPPKEQPFAVHNNISFDPSSRNHKDDKILDKGNDWFGDFFPKNIISAQLKNYPSIASQFSEPSFGSNMNPSTLGQQFTYESSKETKNPIKSPVKNENLDVFEPKSSYAFKPNTMRTGPDITLPESSNSNKKKIPTNFIGDENIPSGTISISVSKKVNIINGVLETKEIKTHKFADGSTQVSENVYLGVSGIDGFPAYHNIGKPFEDLHLTQNISPSKNPYSSMNPFISQSTMPSFHHSPHYERKFHAQNNIEEEEAHREQMNYGFSKENNPFEGVPKDATSVSITRKKVVDNGVGHTIEIKTFEFVDGSRRTIERAI